MIFSDSVLLLIQDIPTESDHELSFFDTGSTISLVSRSFTRRNHMRGVKTSFKLVTVGGKVSSQHTYYHNISLMDSEGVKHTIQAFEIDDICGKLNNIDISAVVGLFNNGVSIADVSRKSGSIELLIGMKHVNIFPVPIAEVEVLMLFSSKFGTNLVLGGTHHLLREADTLGETAVTIAHSQIRNTSVMFDKHLDGGIDFFTSEEFGVKLLPKCDHCRNCRNCTYEIHQISKVERRELKVIENNLILDPVEKRWTTQYPYKQDPSSLGTSWGQVRSLLLKTEKRLSRSEHTCNKYKEQFCDFIDRVVYKELKDEEMRSYRGPVFYVPHHEVYKEDSASTPIRIVINSSLSYNGRSLNVILMKGPIILNDLFGVQLRLILPGCYRVRHIQDVSFNKNN